MQQAIKMYDIDDISQLFRSSKAAIYRAIQESRFPLRPTIGGTGTKKKMLWAPGPVHYYLENGVPPDEYVRATDPRRRGGK